MKRKPLFITAIIAVAIIGIVAVILFVKDRPGMPGKVPEATPEPEPEPTPEPEVIEPNK